MLLSRFLKLKLDKVLGLGSLLLAGFQGSNPLDLPNLCQNKLKVQIKNENRGLSKKVEGRLRFI